MRIARIDGGLKRRAIHMLTDSALDDPSGDFHEVALLTFSHVTMMHHRHPTARACGNHKDPLSEFQTGLLPEMGFLRIRSTIPTPDRSGRNLHPI